MKKRILTGIKPTGYAQIGNYFGAIKPAIELAQSDQHDCFFFIADYHALTTLKTKQEMQEYCYHMACAWLACGLDPNKVVFYKQSDIKEIFEINWILSNVTPKGLMNRAHAYKACVEQNEQNGQDKDANVNMGLYNYPILMSADILSFGTDIVPVGADQKQHIEIARDIATYFNNKYGKVFTLPDYYTQENTSIIYGFDGRKMSKSYNNGINLFCDEKELKNKVNKIVTDSKLPGEPKDVDCTINKLYKLFVSQTKAQEFENQLKNGLGWGDAKKMLFEAMNNYISPMREKYNYYMTHKDEVNKILENGAHKARQIAIDYLQKVRNAIGV